MKENNKKVLTMSEKGNYQINFAMSSPKNGIEQIYKYIPSKNKTQKYQEVAIQDFWEEKRRKRNTGIIGTTLVNILNKLADIRNELNTCKSRINKIDTNQLYELYSNIQKSIKKYDIDKVNKEILQNKYIQIQKDIVLKQEQNILDTGEMLTTREILKTLYKAEDNDYNLICTFLYDIYLEKFDSLDLYDFILDILKYEKDKIEIVETLYIKEVSNIINTLKSSLNFILWDFSFIFNIMIDNFKVDLTTLYTQKETENFIYHKYSLFNTYKYEKPSDTFYNQLREYYEKELDKNNTKFLQDICNMFLDSILSDLEYIELNYEIERLKQKPLINSWIPTKPSDFNVELPRTYISYRSNFEWENYKKQNIKPFIYTYNITTLLELYSVTIYHLRLDNREIHKCKQCERYFVTNTKNSEIFCRREDIKYRGNGIRYCYQVGQGHTKSKNITSIKYLHHTLYNRYYSRWKKYKNTEDKEIEQKYKKEYDGYKQKYKQLRTSWRNKEITKKQLKEELLKELKKDNKRIEKENKKEKRNRHYLTSEYILKQNKK